MELSKPAWGIIWRTRIYWRLSEMAARRAARCVRKVRRQESAASGVSARRAASGKRRGAEHHEGYDPCVAPSARWACLARLLFLALFEVPGHSEHIRENLTQLPATPASGRSLPPSS